MSVEGILGKLQESRINKIRSEYLDESTDSEYQRMKKSYRNSDSFKDKYKESGDIKDLTDDLDNKDIPYEIYHNKKDKGCTVFHDSVDLDEDQEDDDEAYAKHISAMKENPVYKKIESICKNKGYTLKHASYVDNEVDIRISPDKDHPEIYYNYKRFGEVVNQFKIQTWSHGALSLEDYEIYLKNCQDAYDVVKQLQELDLTKLYGGES